MKRSLGLAILSMIIAAPSWLLAQESRGDYDHGQVGIFADYFRFSPTSNAVNFVGFGARTGFNVSHHTQIEAEMNYDFQRSFTNNCTGNCVPGVTFLTTKVRPLTGLFVPKFETSGPFKFFVTGKVGFIRVSESASAVAFWQFCNVGFGGRDTGPRLAPYPGAGFAGFWGPFGLRLEAGDEVYLNNGTFNNLKVSFGPQIRF